MENVILVWVGLFGLVIGSFLNVVIHRLPRQVPFLKGRSVCPHCNAQLKWYHNIPVLSFALLGGRCAFCEGRISYRYPAVEIINALFYVYFYWQFGFSLNFGIFAFLASVLLVIFFIDLDFQIIPDVITLPGIALGLAVSLLPGGIGIVNAAIGLLVGGSSLYLIAMLGDWLFKKESMGGGDVKMAAMLGAFLGWQKIILIFISSAVIGLVVSLVIMIFSARVRETRVVPFGPFLATAAILSIVYGDQLISLYLTNVVGLH
ncbi:MAG: prepilin peptidase [Candidatus Zixiibacteriota bacterium]|nr:MAG: prepilin peptidase [candidate division Zixibacteria bacterium]